MKNIFHKCIDVIFFPLCLISIFHSIYQEYINTLPGILFIRSIFLLCAIAIIVSGLIRMKDGGSSAFSLIRSIGQKSHVFYKGKGLREFFYLNSEYVLLQVFTWYFLIYIIFRLANVSVFFSFIMLFLAGALYGYRRTRSKWIDCERNTENESAKK